MRLLLLFISINFQNVIIAQTAWTWEELAPMPERVANNSVAFGTDGVFDYVFSFGGIDSTKTNEGVNRGAYRYNITTNSWTTIDSVPFSLSNVASGASTVNNLIYIIGGYHINPGGSEVSSNEIIRYDPVSNSYLTNGAEIPTPIDDHVQAVWRDSLIYVVTGWSNSGNVPDVQIYNPALDTWTAGTPTPNTNDYKAFGASGEIIGDTIYYYGGASTGINFPARNLLRKGVINSEDPTEITWSLLESGPNTLYRSAALKYDDNLFWAGGSAISYNYNGIAYNGSGGVPPLTQIMRYQHVFGDWYAGEGAPYGVMDLRGVAQINATQWIICGGMLTDQYVSDQTYLLTYDPIVGSIAENEKQVIKIINNEIIVPTATTALQLIDLKGSIVANISLDEPFLPNVSGFYILRATVNGITISRKVVLP